MEETIKIAFIYIYKSPIQFTADSKGSVSTAMNHKQTELHCEYAYRHDYTQNHKLIV